MSPDDFKKTDIGKAYLEGRWDYPIDKLLEYYTGLKNMTVEQKRKEGFQRVVDEMDATKEIFLMLTKQDV